MMMLATMAAASVVNQATAEGVNQKQRHFLKASTGDSFFSKPVEGYPTENNLALTHSFIFGTANKAGSGKSVHMGQFEVDVLWLYILGALIVIGVVVGAIICCCSTKDDAPPKEEEKKEEENKEENKDEEKGDDKKEEENKEEEKKEE